MTKCEQCGAEVELPFECNFCGGYFCIEHRLPENHNCSRLPAPTPLGHWKAKISPEELAEGKKATVKVQERESTRARHFSHLNWKPRKLLLSLKLWFVIFLVIVSLISFMETSNPTKFYQSVPAIVKYVLYIFASAIGIWTGYRIFEKCDYNPRSDRGIFGLKLLAIGIFVVAVLTFIFGIFFLSGLFV